MQNAGLFSKNERNHLNHLRLHSWSLHINVLMLSFRIFNIHYNFSVDCHFQILFVSKYLNSILLRDQRRLWLNTGVLGNPTILILCFNTFNGDQRILSSIKMFWKGRWVQTLLQMRKLRLREGKWLTKSHISESRLQPRPQYC